MAALRYTINIPSTSLTASTPTVVAFVKAPANQRLKVLGYGFFFDGTVNGNAPVEVKLATPTTGTFTTGSSAQLLEPELTETIQATYGIVASVQPTLSASNTNKTITVHPQLGYEYECGDPDKVRIVAGGTTWCVSVNAPNTVDIRGYVMVEE
jgi:hypothetical protein